MSNLKIIDGVCVNLDSITQIEINCTKEECWFLKIYLNIIDNKGWQTRINILGKTYNTKKEAVERIKQILKNQNSKEVRI